MNTDWVPQAGVGLLATIAGWALGWWRAQGQHDAKTDAELKASRDASAAEMKAFKDASAKETRISEDREDDLRRDIRELREDLRVGIDELRKAASRSDAWQSKQDTVNVFTTKAIESLIATQEKHAEKLNDHGSSIKLLTELVTRENRSTRQQ
jgi:hypothetical protein